MHTYLQSNIYSHTSSTVIYTMIKKKVELDFSKQDRVFYVGGTHIGLTAEIISIGRNRLTVKVELPSYEGYSVKKTNAIVVSEDSDPVKDTNPR